MSEQAKHLFFWLLGFPAAYILFTLLSSKVVVVHHTIRTSPAMVMEPNRYQYYPFGDPRGRYVPQDVI